MKSLFVISAVMSNGTGNKITLHLGTRLADTEGEASDGFIDECKALHPDYMVADFLVAAIPTEDILLAAREQATVEVRP